MWQGDFVVVEACRRVEKKMETTVVYWGYMGIMEKKMEATIIYSGAFREF